MINETALHKAVKMCYIEIIRILLDHPSIDSEIRRIVLFFMFL